MTEVRPLSKAPNPQLLPVRRSVGCPLLQVCVHLDGLNAENTVSLLVILCIIVYVTNKAHLSLNIIWDMKATANEISLKLIFEYDGH